MEAGRSRLAGPSTGLSAVSADEVLHASEAISRVEDEVMTLLDPRLGHAKAEAGSFGQKSLPPRFPRGASASRGRWPEYL